MAQTSSKGQPLTGAQRAFLSWFAKEHPALYKQSVAMGKSENVVGIGGIGDSLATGFASILNNANSLLTTYVTGKTQLAAVKLNVERAKQGLYPIPTSVTAGTAIVKSVPMWVWLGIGGLGLFWLIARK